MDIDEIDAFYAEAKRLQGPAPLWTENSRGELSASWNIEDSIGIVRAHFRFRCPKFFRQWPSLSLIYRGNLVCRVDLVPQSESKPNPIGAASLRLPPMVMVHIFMGGVTIASMCVPLDWDACHTDGRCHRRYGGCRRPFIGLLMRLTLRWTQIREGSTFRPREAFLR
jgi:hypothetical protein